MTAMTDVQKLRILLPHWIEHNVEHAAEFREWAERARVAGQEGPGTDIALAAREAETDASLESHRDRLRTPGMEQVERTLLGKIRSFFKLA